MGVTFRNEIQCPKPDEMSSTESLHIPLNSNGSVSLSSSTNSINNFGIRPATTRRNRNKRSDISDISISLHSRAGKRRQRRFKAVAELSALIEEDETEVIEDEIPHNSVFTALLENPEVEEFWDQFTAKNEDEQAELLNEKIDKCRKSITSYQNISFNIKVVFKTMRSIYELEKTEAEIVEFFTKFPKKVYLKKNKNSYQRLLIHGVAEYYCLKSSSFDAEDGSRTIRVVNPNNSGGDFCEKRLYTIIQDNHKKRR